MWQETYHIYLGSSLSGYPRHQQFENPGLQRGPACSRSVAVWCAAHEVNSPAHPRAIPSALRFCPYTHGTLALTPGTRLGVYDITAPIGEGGMGQVYRATDTTLNRQVAIKILPDAFAAGPRSSRAV